MLEEIRLSRGIWSYDPGALLGQPGGFGAVFRGYGPTGEQVAVKRLHLSASEAAHRELKVAEEGAGRSFHYVVPVLDSGQDAKSDQYFVVMPLAQESLQEVIDREGQVTEARAAGILRQIAQGLSEVGALVHRDLKPANVLLHDGRWCIADFGIARFVEDSTSARTLKDCLSPQFAAPEQWKYDHATNATDIYALGFVGVPC